MERETHRDRETRGGAGRQPGPAAPAPALSGEGGAEPRQTGRFGRGSCSPRGRPKDQRGELEVYAPLLTPRAPVDGTVEPPGPAAPLPSPPLLGAPVSPRPPPGSPWGSVHTRTQPALPAACCEAVGPPRAAAGAAAVNPSPAHAASASGPVPPRLRLPRERHGLAGGGVRPGRSGHRRPGPALLSRSRFSRSFWSFRGFALLHVLESAY